MHKITDHGTDPVNNRIGITAMDESGPGGPNYYYAIDDGSENGLDIYFQNGPIAENGVTPEVLLAVVIDWLRNFQTGPFACKENAAALECSHQALDWLKVRTKARGDET